MYSVYSKEGDLLNECCGPDTRAEYSQPKAVIKSRRILSLSLVGENLGHYCEDARSIYLRERPINMYRDKRLTF
jgi:hypothetical protein